MIVIIIVIVIIILLLLLIVIIDVIVFSLLLLLLLNHVLSCSNFFTPSLEPQSVKDMSHGARGKALVPKAKP